MSVDYQAVQDVVRAIDEFGRAQREIVVRLSRALDLPKASIGMLRYLYVEGPVPIGCAAQHFRVDLSVASRHVTTLVDADLVRRDVDPDDRRVRTIDLTPLGRSTVDKLREVASELVMTMFQDWDPAELKVATDHMTAIAQTIAQHQGDQPQTAHPKESKDIA